MIKNTKLKSGLEIKRARLFVVEEQEILREAYEAIFPLDPTIELAGITGDNDPEAIMDVLSALQPDAIILGIRTLHPSTISQVEVIREHFPEIGIIILATHYDIQGMKELQRSARKGSKGYAFLLKHSLDRISQLTQVVHGVIQGHVIFDAMVMEDLSNFSENRAAILKELTHRELEVLSLMAKRYRNGTIADVLCIDAKTVERHVHSIYSKLNIAESDYKHPRVNAIMLYIQATGQLPYDNFFRESENGETPINPGSRR